MPNGEAWPEITRQWWAMWGDDPLTEEYCATDWADLIDAAVLHGLYWSGVVSVASELRLRVAKHGATQEDRARLRIQYAAADTAETKRDRAKAGNGGGRYSGLQAV
jgi:hypothetical protein